MTTSSISLQQINPDNFVPPASNQTIRHAHFNGVSLVDLKTEALIFEHCVFEECSFASAEFDTLKNLKISTDQCIPFLALFEIEVV